MKQELKQFYLQAKGFLKAKSTILLIFFCSISLLAQPQKYLEAGASVSRIGEFFKSHSKQKAYKYANPSFSISAGIVKRKWNFGIGFSYHTIYEVYEYQPKSQYKQITSNLQFFSLPLSVKYAFMNRNKSKLSVTSTVSYLTNLIVKEHFRLTYKSSTPPVEGPSVSDMRLVCSLGFEYEKKINRNFSIEIGTSMKFVDQGSSNEYTKYNLANQEFIIIGFFPSLSITMKYYLNKKSIK